MATSSGLQTTEAIGRIIRLIKKTGDGVGYLIRLSLLASFSSLMLNCVQQNSFEIAF